MRPVLFGPFVLAACAASAAFPVVTLQDVSVDAATRRVTVSYVVSDAPAVVTANFLTNGVALAEGVATTLYGDVNVVVSNRAEAYSFAWNPDRDLQADLPASVDLSVELTAWSANDPPPYLAVDLTQRGYWFFYASSNAVPGGVQDVRYKTDLLLLRKIPAANQRFRMGSPVGERGGQSSEFGTVASEVLHYVTLTADYYIGVYEVTQRQYKRINGSKIGKFLGYEVSDTLPVESVLSSCLRGSDWPANPDYAGDANKWLTKLRTKTGVATFDLPTDAQWEFACRAGTETGLNNGTQLNFSNGWSQSPGSCTALDVVAWWSANAEWEVVGAATGETETLKTTHPVGLKMPNAWGLYDMHGNVAEFCRDWYSEGAAYSDGSDVVDPVGPASEVSATPGRVVRGGALGNPPFGLRSASRSRRREVVDLSDVNLYQNGFRVMCRTCFGVGL